MPAFMTENTVRLTVHVKEENRDALKLEALVRGLEMGEVLDELIEAGLTTAIEQIRARRAPEGPKRKRSGD